MEDKSETNTLFKRRNVKNRGARKRQLSNSEGNKRDYLGYVPTKY